MAWWTWVLLWLALLLGAAAVLAVLGWRAFRAGLAVTTALGDAGARLAAPEDEVARAAPKTPPAS